MHYVPTHVVSVIAEDEDGEQSTAATLVPVSIHRAGTSRFDDRDTALKVRAPHGTPVRALDKLTDGTSWWLVDLVTEDANPVTGMDMLLECRQIEG